MNVRNFIPLSDFNFLTNAVLDISREVFSPHQCTIRIWEGPHHLLHFHDVTEQDFRSFIELVRERFTELSEKQTARLDELINLLQTNWDKAHATA
ncbi:MAG: hypothetical protein RLZZ480_845 [Candidatus Parcubacteria bacterium]|jgi:predicted metallopeptidase